MKSKAIGVARMGLATADLPGVASVSNNIPEASMLFAEYVKYSRILPRAKKQRIVGYYDPLTDKPQPRNEPCRCGSGKKFKKCCINKPK